MKVLLTEASGFIGQHVLLADFFEGKKKAFEVNVDTYRDFLHVSDVANALFILSKSQASGTFNISSGEALPIRTIVNLMAKTMSASPSEIFEKSSKRLDQPKMLVGNNKLLRKLGWNKKIELVNGIKDFIT